MSTRIANIYVNDDSYRIDIWLDNSTGTFFVMDASHPCYAGTCGCETESGCGKSAVGMGRICMGEIIPIQTWTIGETCRWIHTGRADGTYNWLQVGEVQIYDTKDAHYRAHKEFQKDFLEFAWDELFRKGFHHIVFDMNM